MKLCSRSACVHIHNTRCVRMPSNKRDRENESWRCRRKTVQSWQMMWDVRLSLLVDHDSCRLCVLTALDTFDCRFINGYASWKWLPWLWHRHWLEYWSDTDSDCSNRNRSERYDDLKWVFIDGDLKRSQHSKTALTNSRPQRLRDQWSLNCWRKSAMYHLELN